MFYVLKGKLCMVVLSQKLNNSLSFGVNIQKNSYSEYKRNDCYNGFSPDSFILSKLRSVS